MKPPCEKCISYAICNARLKSIYAYGVMGLVVSCSKANEYAHTPHGYVNQGCLIRLEQAFGVSKYRKKYREIK